MASGSSLRSRMGWTGRWHEPSVVASVLFLLLFSGPPRFRHRPATASLHGEIDAVILFQIVVWVMGGVWVLYQMQFYFRRNGEPVGFRLPQKLGLAMVVILGLSTFVSVAPELTAFKVYQMLVCMLFAMVFVERYGVEACLKKLFHASAVMCVAIAVAAFAFPDLVYVVTETGAQRLRGDYLSGTEVSSLYCLILLLGGVQRLSKIAYGLLLGLCCTLLVASLSRTAYLALFLIFLLVLLKRPSSKPFRRFAYISAVVVIPLVMLSSFFDLSRYRNPEGVWTLSDRIGLWIYLSNVTLQKSPLLGLGYYAAGRFYGYEYDTTLASAHSMFFETIVGGGLVAITVLLILCVVMAAYAGRVFGQNTGLSFTVTILFVGALMFGSIGPTLDSGPVAMVFWCLAAILPILHGRGLASARVAAASRKRLVEAQCN